MLKGDFAVVSEVFFVRKNEFSESHESVESSESDGNEKEIVV